MICNHQATNSECLRPLPARKFLCRPFQALNDLSTHRYCFRICTAANSTYSAAQVCEHTLDVGCAKDFLSCLTDPFLIISILQEVGCNFVMPGNYDNGTFTECDADSAYPPGIYPQPDGSTSTFAQRYTGSYTNDGTLAYWTVGQTVTPSGAASTPASSNCQTFTNISKSLVSITP